MPDVRLIGRLGDRAMLLVGSKTLVLSPGISIQGWTLNQWQGDAADVLWEGQSVRLTLDPGLAHVAAPAHAASTVTATSSTGGRIIQLQMDAQGMYRCDVSIHRQKLPALVDTGASAVTLSQAQAEQVQVAWQQGRSARAQTAGGALDARLITLERLEVSGVEVNRVDALVISSQLPYVLLGQSFLNRFHLRQDNGRMSLELKTGSR